MESLVNTFRSDIDDACNAITSVQLAATLPELEIPESITSATDPFSEAVVNLRTSLGNARAGLVKAPGVYKLYLAGLFESFVQTLLEELAIRISARAPTYSDLPRELKDCLIKDTSKVIGNPRKFGHGEGAVSTFIKNLYQNIHENDMTRINHQCISITEANMRPEIISELFSKVGLKKIWEDVGNQTATRTFFGGVSASSAQSKATKYLNNFMDSRNEIAHSNASITWPSTESVMKDSEYFKMIASVLLDIAKMKEAAFQTELSTTA